MTVTAHERGRKVARALQRSIGMEALYRDRRHAGHVLAARLADLGQYDDVVVLALPRGGVPVAYEVAVALGKPLDVFVVRKLGYPGHEELAIGAIASGGAVVLNDAIAREVPADVLERIRRREQRELERREQRYRQGRPACVVANKRVVLVDDGLATGASLLVAVNALRARRPARIIAAVPVAPADICDELATHVDEMICAQTPARFRAVGQFYADFDQTTDEEVETLLAAADRGSPRRPGLAEGDRPQAGGAR